MSKDELFADRPMRASSAAEARLGGSHDRAAALPKAIADLKGVSQD
jgi:hypothetical protein